ncbi:MAG: SET domain-containing protein-lysine N-methyltransferase [Myxococcales bacterium]|nr:MAG: SET domain-containing protein-lysine N-methyltransferase [Myxococcales bacterium]
MRETSYAGRGVFAAEDIPAGALIEECPILVLPEAEMAAAMGTMLGNYVFQWGPAREQGAVALGYGSLFNHSYSPNAMYIRKLHTSTLMFVALAPIAAGAEILVNYNGSPEDRDPVWFDAGKH